jgi:hypothetical protein
MKLVSTGSQCDLWDFRLASLSSWRLRPFGLLLAGYRLFRATYRSHLEGDLEDGPDVLSRNVGNKLPTYSAQHPTSEDLNVIYLHFQRSVTVEGCRTCHSINTMIYNAIQVLNTWVVQVFVVILQEYHIKQNKIYRSIVW